MATINKIPIPDLDPIGDYLDNTDEFIVFDNRTSGVSKARKVTYKQIKDNFVNPHTTIPIGNGFKYNFSDDDTTLHIVKNSIALDDATEEKSGVMSATDKQALDQLTEIDLNLLGDSFNTKVKTGSTETLYNISSIQGVQGVSTYVEEGTDGNVLKISVNDVNKISIYDKDTKIYTPIDYLETGDGIKLYETTPLSDGIRFKIDLDTDYLIEKGFPVSTTIKADVDEQEQDFSKLVAGDNIIFSKNLEGELVISNEEGSDIDPTPIIQNNQVYECQSEASSSNKKIETEDTLQIGDIFTVYFTNGYGDTEDTVSTTLIFGEIDKPILYNSNSFKASLINNYATFVNEENCFALISTDVNISNLFDENGIIKSQLLPENSGESSSIISYPIGEEIGRDDSNHIFISLSNYSTQEGTLIAIHFNRSVSTPAFLNVNDTGSFSIVCQNNSVFDNTLISDNSIALFVFDQNHNYTLLSVDNAINVKEANNTLITTITKGANEFSVINSNILDSNNQLITSVLPSMDNYVLENDILTEEGRLKTSIMPVINTNSNINATIDNSLNTIILGLNLSDDEDANNLYLNGEGDWSYPTCILNNQKVTQIAGDQNINVEISNEIMTISLYSNLIQTLTEIINDQFIPVGTYYYTSDPYFHPGDKGDGAGGAHWWSQNQQIAYENLRWELDENKSDTNANPPIYCWHKMGTPLAG